MTGSERSRGAWPVLGHLGAVWRIVSSDLRGWWVGIRGTTVPSGGSAPKPPEQG